MAGRLSDAVLVRVPDGLRQRMESDDGLEAALEAMVAEAQSAFPGLNVEPEVFVAYMADRLDHDAEGDPVAAVRSADLYLACACALGVDGAFKTFEDTFLPQVAKAIGHMDRTGVLVDDVMQGLRTKLFATATGELGKIADFSGRSKLWRWLRVIATRLAIDLAAKDRLDKRLGEDDIPDLGADLEFDHLKGKYAGEFKQAFEKAMADLEHRERSLLRMSFIDHMSIDQLGTLHKVHRATAARWLQQARERLAALTKDHLRDTLNTSPEEVESIMRLIRSHMDVSIHRLLKE